MGTEPNSKSKKRLSQSDVPGVPLQQALRIARALADLGKVPSTPVQVAAVVGIQPTSGPFRTLAGASIAYGLTSGGYNAARIELTDLGRRVVAPTVEGDDLVAMREAVLHPRVTREFLTRFDGGKWPRDDIGRNVLEAMGVPAERAAHALRAIWEDADALGLLVEINNDRFVQMNGPAPAVPRLVPGPDAPAGPEDIGAARLLMAVDQSEVEPMTSAPMLAAIPVNNRVFITHGKNTAIVKQLKDLLTYGKFVPVVAAENQTVAKPVPDKVLDDMRSCAAGIVHVGAERRLLDGEGTEHDVLNPNVLIEIGAAMALYGRRFILLVEKGTQLPSNLQGLYEVRYEGNGLDYEATMNLLKAFSDFGNDMEDPQQAA